MFDVTANEIAQLNDTELRELVGRLCEAELTSRGLSPAAVTWGGKQTAADGGLDVRVALPTGTVIDGFVQRPSTGFQVKTPDMQRAAILVEMRPRGDIRAVIQELAEESGSYIIVSSHGTTTDSALRKRRNALREALTDVANADKLYTDFYDRTRLATWVRCHPGLITWVKEKLGRALVGWRPYGAWSGVAEDVDGDYLLDDKLRLHLGKRRDMQAQPVADAIDQLRDELAQPGKMIRLIGLSGVGKTRLVQALFDTRIGLRSLPPSLAVYTNLSDNPNPQPIGIASDLVANRTRAVLIVDNCPPDLHRRLLELCSAPGSMVSVLTVEYDVRDDQPEGTQVVTLETSSPELIEKLVKRRFPHLSEVDARTIAESSGGNARIAIALAETIDRSETIAGLSDDDLFQRLFRQRHEPNNSLLLAAQACSLVYSFQGEALAGEEAELPRLALLADQAPQELYRHVGELLRRDLVQKRSVWRAVLPHAIANRLAARALEDTPYDLIEQQFVTGGTDRLARSFSRRLSFLHDQPRAIDIVERWLASGGLLGDVTALSELGRTMFENVAPVLPEAALAALERANHGDSEVDAPVLRRFLSLLRSLAYDQYMFERSTTVLAWVVTRGKDERDIKEALDVFISLFTLYLSGTHATIEQRLRIIERLLRSSEGKARSLGLAALGKVLEAMHFSSGHGFEFGARSRDYGYRPKSDEEVTRWYRGALELIQRLALTDGLLKSELRDLLAQNFRGLWTSAHMYDELVGLSRGFVAQGFWREGWAACRLTIQFDNDLLSPDGSSRLSNLEVELRPSNLSDRVRAVVLGDGSDGLDFEGMNLDGDIVSEFERLESIAQELGVAVVADEAVFAELLSDLLRGGFRAWAFGRGLASASQNHRTTWAKLVKGLENLPVEQRNVGVLRGFLSKLWDEDRVLVQALLDTALHEPALVMFLPVLQTAVLIDSRGVERLKQTLRSAEVPVQMYRNLALGRATDNLSAGDLKDLLLLIADKTDGFEVAVEVLHMQFHSDHSAQRSHEPAVLEAGQKLLQGVRFKESNHRSDYHLASVVRACLTDKGAGPIAAEVARRLRRAVARYETQASNNDNLLKALLSAQPTAVLDALFKGDDGDQRSGIKIFGYLREHRSNPADVLLCEDLVAWCNRDREHRYALAAAFVTFARRAEESGPLVWSEQASALLINAPDPRCVLAVFVERFRPNSWSGSRAALMEANTNLLNILEFDATSELILFVAETKDRLTREIAIERQLETKRDQARDERFE